MILREILASIDGAYLVALSNKGTYKRALKELESGAPEMKIEADSILAKFPDGTETMIPANIKDYKCSCPAREACKHLIMALIAAKGSAGANAAPIEANFDALLAETPKALEKKAGKKNYKKAVFQLEMQLPANIDAGSTLLVSLSTGHSVRFLPGAGIEAAKCSCKAAGVCEHKVEALLHYIKEKTGQYPEGLFEKDAEAEDSVDVEIVPFMMDFVKQFFNTGLTRAPENYASRFEHLGVLCHSRRLANLERLCNRIAGQLENMQQRSAAFSDRALLGYLCEFINNCRMIQAGNTERKLIGAFRDEYNLLSTVTLHGLGASKWESIGGYRGVTAYFYCLELQKTVHYSNAMPIERALDLNSIYTSSTLWNTGGALASLSRSKTRLRNGKLSLSDQLSASSESEGTILANTDKNELSELIISDFTKIPDMLWESDKRAVEVILSGFTYGEGRFDEIKQTYYLPLLGQQGKLTIAVKYKAFDAVLMDNIRVLASKGGDLFVRIYVDKGEMVVLPVALYANDGKIVNLSIEPLEAPADKRNAKKYYNW